MAITISGDSPNFTAATITTGTVTTLTSTTLSDGTNSTSVTNLVKGSCVAWVVFNGVTTVTINASYNVSSVTRTTTGQYTINFTNALVDNNYIISGSVGFNANGNGFLALPPNLTSGTYTTTAAPITTNTSNQGYFDGFRTSVAFFR